VAGTGTRIQNGGHQNTSSGYTVGTEGLQVQEKAWTAKEKLHGHHQTRSEGHGQLDITWDEAEEMATDRAEWRQRVAQCTRLDAGRGCFKIKIMYHCSRTELHYIF